MRRVALLVLALAGCGGPKLADVQVVSASLQSTSVDVVLFGGGSAGGGNVNLLDTNGDRWNLKVKLSSGTVGSLMDFGIEGASAAFDTNRSGAVTVDDILGDYEGAHYSGALLVGANGYDLENEKHVALNGGGTNVGLGLYAGHVWLGIDADGDLVPAGGAVVDAGP